MFRVGSGLDNHRLEKRPPDSEQKLWVGGVAVSDDYFAVAHSDGDVLLHALTDALLGAVGEGDIGVLFPDTDPENKDRPSHEFVRAAAAKVRERGYALVNIDATVILEKIKLFERKTLIAARIREILADEWDLDPSAVNVKAKTNERCDAVGEGRAIAAQVTVLVQKL